MKYNCNACKTLISPFLDLGKMPLANGYLDEDKFKTEYFYNLAAALCPKCSLFQIVECPDPDRVFNPNYPHVTGISHYMKVHFRLIAETLRNEYLLDVHDPFVVEIGSNDGTFLQNFLNWGIRHLGIEPTKSVADIAINNGIKTEIRFFNEENAKAIRKNYSAADIIFGANVIAHIKDIKSVANGVRELLKDDGLFIFEAIYLGDIINNLSYDQIYDEHVYTFSAQAVSQVFGLADLELIDVLHLPTQGGSMRYVLAPKGRRIVKTSVEQLFSKEENEKLNSRDTMSQFGISSMAARDSLCSLIGDLKTDGKVITGYGAATKSTIILNYCGFTSNEIDYIVDSTPLKQNRYSPGTHIPVYSPTKFRENPPEYALLFAWNHLEEITRKERPFSERGGQWILPVPIAKLSDELSLLMPKII